MSVNPNKFSRQRADVLLRDYPAGVAGIVILERLNALPGPSIDSADVVFFSKRLGLTRPHGFEAQKANAEVRAARALEAQSGKQETATPPSVDIRKPCFKSELTFTSHFGDSRPKIRWNDRAIEVLTALWRAGLSMEQIALRMGTGKNAICGKVHRLNLDARPSPIKRSIGDETPRRKRPRAIGDGKTLPPLKSVFDSSAIVDADDREAPVVALPPPVKPAPRIVRAIAKPPAPKVVQLRPREGNIMPCQWPIGEPRDKDFRFCLADSEPGRPYCFDHCCIAYVIPKARCHQNADESAAA